MLFLLFHKEEIQAILIAKAMPVNTNLKKDGVNKDTATSFSIQEKSDMKNTAIVLVLFIIALLLIVFADDSTITITETRVDLEDVSELFEAEGEDSYHSTKEILLTAQNVHTLNPFYCPQRIYGGSSATTGNSEHLLAYGPCGESEKQLRVLIICGQHGRERISSEVCYHLIKLIQLSRTDSVFTEQIQRLTQWGVGLWIVPVVNTYAFYQIDEYPELYCLRKNSREIDLNRNFEPPTWCEEPLQRSRPQSSDYAGEVSMSELETKATKILLDEVKPHMLLNLHSGARSILLPYDCSSERWPQNYNLMTRLANSVKRHACQDCSVGSSSLLLYKSAGTLMDYAVSFSGVPLAFTLELYQDPSADMDIPEENLTAIQCRKWFNPQEGDPYRKVVTESLQLIFSMTEMMRHYSAKP